MTRPVPEKYHTVTAALVVPDARAAMDLYAKAFGAELGDVMELRGAVIHAEFKIGDSWMFINDDMEMMPRRPAKGTQSTGFFLYVEDCDAVFARAVEAGMKVVFELSDQFWGDRTGTVEDPYGYQWTLATQKEDLTLEEIEARREKAGW